MRLDAQHSQRRARKRVPGRRHAHWLPSAGGLSTRLAYNRAEAAKVELTSILKKANLTREQLGDRKTPVRVHDQIRFLSLVADALADDLLGFHLAQDHDLREI